MGGVLKRVPLDFDYPLNEVWKGYLASNSKDKISHWKDYEGVNICSECKKRKLECSERAEYCLYHPDNKAIWYYEPPVGEGFQLWETTSEGSPQSPVFETLDDLCQWCEGNATTFAHHKATKEEWKQMLSGKGVRHTEGNITFL